MDEEKIVIRGLLRHYWKKGLSAKAAAEQICEVEGADTIHRNTAAIWFKRFNEGDTSLRDKDRSGRPPVVDDEALVRELKNQPNASNRDLSDLLGHSKSTINLHLKQLGYVAKRPRMEPHNLTEAQAKRRVDICNELLKNPLDDRFWKRIVTCDEKWVFLYNPDKRKQWVLHDQEAIPVVQQSRFDHKVMICVWWNFEGILHFELIPNGRTINADLYSQQLDTVYEVLKSRYSVLVNRKGVLYQHDNAPAHRARSIKAKLDELPGVEVLPHPPYSPDLAPSDYGLFRSMASFLRGRRFETYHDVDSACREFFASKSKEWYSEKIRNLAERWAAVIENNGLYFEE